MEKFAGRRLAPKSAAGRLEEIARELLASARGGETDVITCDGVIRCSRRPCTPCTSPPECSTETMCAVLVPVETK